MSSAIRCHSFDVFDTCLTRVLATPQDVFYLLGERMLQRTGMAFHADDVHEFVRERLEAERRARKASSREDIPLGAIYACYQSSAPFDLSPQEMMDGEIAIEKEVLRPIPEMLDTVRSLRANGKRIAFISDMFLPKAVIADCLTRHGFMAKGDTLYVSGDIGLTKHTGRLFQYALDDMGLAAAEMEHTGDNRHTDVAIPRRLGIRCRPFTAGALTSLETAMLGRQGRTDLVRSGLAGAARLARMHGQGRAHPHQATVAADVAAPLITGFVAWVLEQARKQGVKVLWFVARDGQIMRDVALELLGDAGDIECRYLYGSRQAWFLPSITTFTPEALPWLFIPGHCCKPASIVAKLGCSPAAIEAALKTRLGRFWDTPLPPRERPRLLQLLATPAVAALIEEKARAARANVIGYLRQEGVSEDTPLVLVDVGWTLKAQQSLATILRAQRLACAVSGFYLGVSQSALTAAKAGRYQAYFLERENWFDRSQPMNFLFRNANIIEQVFTAATHGQTTGYEYDGKRYRPVLRNDARTAENLAAVEAMQEHIRVFARQVKARGLADCPNTLRQLNHEILRSFLSAPAPELVESLRELPSFDDQNETRRRRLARPITPVFLAQALAMGTPLATFFPRPDFRASFDWLEGSIALSPPWLRPLLRTPYVTAKLKTWRKSL